METLARAAAQVDWLGLGVNPDDVERMVATGEVEGVVTRLARPVWERVFRGAGLGALAAMSDAEAARTIAKAVTARHGPAVDAFRRLALCLRLVSGKRADALALVEDALKQLEKEGNLPRVTEKAPPASKSVPLRDRHVAIAFDLLEHDPRRLILYPLLDRAVRVSYRAYVPDRLTGGPGAGQIAALTYGFVEATIERALGAAQGVRLDEVVAVDPWRFVFLREQGSVRIVETEDGGVLAPAVERHILKFGSDGRLEVSGGAVAVRLAEALMSTAAPVRYVPYQPESGREAVRDVLLRLVEGRLPGATVERVLLSYSSFEIEARGDLAAALRTLAGVPAGPTGRGGEPVAAAPEGGWTDRVSELVLSVALEPGSALRFTLWFEEVKAENGVRVTYRAASAGLREREAFEREAARWGIAVSPR